MALSDTNPTDQPPAYPEKLGDLVPALRRLLRWAEDHPDLPPPIVTITEYYYTDDPDAKLKLAAFARSLPKTSKHFYSDTFSIEHKFGDRVNLQISSNRSSVCTRRVVGTKVIPAASYPERTEELVEWDCSEPLLAASPSSENSPT